MGRTTRGVKGITLGKDDEIIALDIIKEGANGFSLFLNMALVKELKLKSIDLKAEGVKVQKTIAQSSRNGNLVSLMVVEPGDDIMTISMEGQMIRLPISDISVIGRVTQGVCVMNIPEEDKIVAVARVLIKDDEEEE